MIISRSIGRDGMGQYDLLRQVGTLAATIVSLGIGNATIFFLNNRKVPLGEIVANNTRIFIVLGSILFVSTWIAIKALPAYFGEIPSYVAAVFAFGIASLLGTTFFRPIMVSALEARKMVVVNVSLPVCILLGAAVLGICGLLTTSKALILLAIANITSFIVTLSLVMPSLSLKGPFNWHLLRGLLSYGVKLSAANILQVVFSAASIMLLRYLTIEDFGQVGLYTRAVALCGLGMLVPTAIGPLLYAKWSSADKQERLRQVQIAGRFCFAYGLCVAVFLMLFGKYLLWLLYGKDFIAGQIAVYGLGPALASFSLFNVYINLFAGEGRAGITAWILTWSVFAVLLANWLLVPQYGILGAAIAELIAQLTSLIIAALVGWRLFRLNPFLCLVITPSDIRYGFAQFMPMNRK